MARKEKDVTIDAEGRDKGKTFRITEMGAFPAERWATRAFLALAKSGIEIPDDIASQGMAGVAALGLKAFAGVNYYDIEPLLEEMLTCVQIVETKAVRKLTQFDVEEIATIVLLRKEVFAVHTDFLQLAALSKGSTDEAPPAG